MSDDEMLRAAKAEVLRLEAELSQSEVFKKLQLARQVVSLYSQGEEKREPSRPFRILARPGTKTARIENAAAAYLRRVARRASSGELTRVILEQGIPLSGSIPAKTLSAILSNSNLFNNDRSNGGYGLKEWDRSPPSNETPDSDEPLSGASRTNGQLPLNS